MSATHRNIFCCKLQREAPALTHAPYPGDLGQRILAKVSQEAWDMWLDKQTKLINEYRLNPLDTSAREFLEKAMLSELFPHDSDNNE